MAHTAAPLSFNLRRSRHHNLRPERPSNLRTLRTFGAKPPSTLTPKVCPRAQPDKAETFGGIFILLGLFYRPMALFLVGNLMMAASIELASGTPLLQVLRPSEEGVFYLGVVFAGPGRYSLDHLLRNEVGEEEQNPF